MDLASPSKDSAKKENSKMTVKLIDNSNNNVNSRTTVESKKLNQVDMAVDMRMNMGILKSTIYKSRPVKKATIKDLSSVKLDQAQEEVTVADDNEPNDFDSLIKSTVNPQLNRKNLNEKVPVIKVI